MDNFLQNAMKPEHMVMVDLSHALGSDRHGGRDQIGLLREVVHNNAYSIVPL